MFQLIFIITQSLCSEIFMNIQEYKIYPFEIDSQHNILTSILEVIPEQQLHYTKLIDIAFNYQPFEEQQLAAFLTIVNGNYTIIEVEYNKFLNSDEINITNQYNVLWNTAFTQESTKCFGLLYVAGQIIVDCSVESTPSYYENYFFLQNGSYTQNIGFQDRYERVVLNTDSSFIRISKNQIEEFSQSLDLIQESNMEVIEAVVSDKDIFILDSQAITIYHSDDTTEFIPHNCTQTPTSMAVFLEQLYVACGNIIQITNNNTSTILSSIQGTHLDNTNQFLIIDFQYVYELINYTLIYYASNSFIYPQNIYNYVLLVNQSKGSIQPALLQNYSVITANSVSTFEIGNDQFICVDSGLQKLNRTPTYNASLTFQQAQPEYINYNQYVTGSNLNIITNGETKWTPYYDLNEDLQNIQILAATGYKNKQSILVYLDNDQLIIILCHFEIQQSITSSCNNKQVVQNNITSISNVRLVYNEKQDIVVLGFNENNQTYIYVESILELIPYSQEFEIGINYLITKNDSILQVYELKTNQYELSLSKNINNDQYTCITSQENLIYLINNSISTMLIYTQYGWQIADINPIFIESVNHCKILEDQLFLFGDDKLEIIRSIYPRGQFNLEVKNPNYSNSKHYHYIYNHTHLYQYSASMEQSLTSALQHIFVGNVSNFVAISLPKYEIIVMNNQLLAIQNVPQFKPNTQTTANVYYQPINTKFTFTSLDQKLNVSTTIIGTLLKLETQVNSKLLKISIDNETNIGLLPVYQIFSGPIANISVDDEDYYVKPRIFKSQELEQEFVDFIDLENSNFTLFKTKLQYCSDNNDDEDLCKDILYSDKICYQMYLDQQNLYVICQDSIYNSTLNNITNFTFHQINTTFIERIKFSNNLMAIHYQYPNKQQNLTIYNDFQQIANNRTDDLVDFVFNASQLLLLNTKTLQYTNSNLILIENVELLQQLAESKATVVFENAVFTNIYRINSSQYIISTSNSLIFKLKMDQSNFEILSIYVTVLNKIPLELEFNEPILSIVYKGESYVTVIFYDDDQEINSTNIVPYFQGQLLYQKIGQKYLIKTKTGYLMRGISNIEQYQVQNQIQLMSNQKGTQMLELIAMDANGQKANGLVEVQIANEDYNQSKWDEILSDPTVLISIYIFVGILALFIIYFIIVQIRRCCMLKKIKFEESKPQEFSSEYI